MLFKQVLMIIICIFFILGMLDHYFGDRFGFGQEFKRAFGLSGTVILSVVGMISLSPVMASFLQPIVVPLFSFLGADAAMFAPTFLSPDSGGYAIAMQMAADPQVGAWAGTVVAAHIGSTFSFNIPVSLGVIDKKNYRFFSLGALSGIIACPFGCILGGVLAQLPFLTILRNMVPALIVSLIVILGLYIIPEKFIKGFVFLGRFLTFVVLIGLTLAVIERLTGIVLLPGMNPISDGLVIAGTVVATIAGIFGLTYLITITFRRQLASLSRRLHINEITILGILNALATLLPGCATYEKMDDRGKVLFAAFTASAGNILGAHLGFIGTTAPALLMPTIVGKLFSGLIAFGVALLLSRSLISPVRKSEKNFPGAIPSAMES